MSNWSFKFRNSKLDAPAKFLENLFIFKKGYHISNYDKLENLDAVFAEEAL